MLSDIEKSITQAIHEKLKDMDLLFFYQKEYPRLTIVQIEESGGKSFLLHLYLSENKAVYIHSIYPFRASTGALPLLFLEKTSPYFECNVENGEMGFFVSMDSFHDCSFENNVLFIIKLSLENFSKYYRLANGLYSTTQRKMFNLILDRTHQLLDGCVDDELNFGLEKIYQEWNQT